MKTSPKRRSRDGRRVLTMTALALFSRKGFEDTSVEDICLAAGYSKGGFYFHFGGKDDLLAQALEGAADSEERWAERLLIDLWAQAVRNEVIRRNLAGRYEARSRELLAAALVSGKRENEALARADLLMSLEAGLRIQQRLAPIPAGKAEDLVDSQIAALTGRSRETGRRKAAGQ